MEKGDKVESVLKWQLIISTVLLTPTIIGVTYMCLPDTFYVPEIGVVESYRAYICCLCGLWSGLLIGYITEIMTSHSYSPVRELAMSCTSGAATNIIFGLALGYLSTIVPVIALALTIFVSMKLLSMFGVALAALGMLSNLCIGLTIDAYGPISDNAGGIA
jgi:Na+/H+-translocating membrane pyrophosphatase